MASSIGDGHVNVGHACRQHQRRTGFVRSVEADQQFCGFTSVDRAWAGGEAHRRSHRHTVDDDSLEGPTELDAGDTSIEIVNDSSTNREINLLKIAEGNTIEDVFAFFESAEEGPPDFASAPLDFFAFVFDGASDRTITVDLTEGQWAIQTPDPEQPFEGPPTEDPHTILLTVS